MNEVRLTIFVIGVLVLLGIWLHWRWLDAPGARDRRTARRATRATAERAELASAADKQRSRLAAARRQNAPPAQAPEADDFPDDPFAEAASEEPRREPTVDDLPGSDATGGWHEPSLDASGLDDLDADDDRLPVLEDIASAGEFPYETDEPEIADDPEPDEADDLLAEADASEAPEEPEVQEEFILVLHVMAADGAFINGRDIDRVLEGLGLVFSEEGIYHYLTEVPGEDEPVRVFSVANMLEPGTFDTARLDEIATPGLALFSVLPGEHPGPRVFEHMLALAADMADQLEGEVLDDRRRPLTSERRVQLAARVRAL